MLYMCDFELEYNLSMHVYRYMYLIVFVHMCIKWCNRFVQQTSWIPWPYIAGVVISLGSPPTLKAFLLPNLHFCRELLGGFSESAGD